MKKDKKYFFTFTFLFLVSIFVTCRPAKRDIVVIYDRPPRTFDPHLRYEIVTVSILSNIYEALIDYTPDLRLVPCLARQWHRKDSLTWILDLRKGVYFHNGKEMRSNDVVYSLYRILRTPESEMGALARIIDTIYATNTYQITIKLNFPHPYFLGEFNHLFILPEGFKNFNEPIGTGPYRAAHISVDSVVLLLNDRYWGKKPRINKGVFKFNRDLRKNIEELRKGAVDIVYNIPIELYHKYKDSIKMVIAKGVATRYIQMDIRTPPFNNRLLRQAISLSINREEIVDEYYYGLAEPANQYIPKGLIGYSNDLPPLQYNPESARVLVKRAGIVKFKFYYGKPVEKLGKRLACYFRDAGLNVEEKCLAPDEFWQGVEKRHFNFYLLSSIVTALDGINTILESSFRTYNPERGEGLMNRSGYTNRIIDSLLDYANRLDDSHLRLDNVTQIQMILLNDMPIIPIVWEPRIYGVANFIEFSPRLDQKVRLNEIGLKR